MNNQELIDDFKRNINNSARGNGGLTSSNLSVMLACGYPSNDELLYELNDNTKAFYKMSHIDAHQMCSVIIDAISKISIEDAFFRFYMAIKNKVIYQLNDTVNIHIFGMDHDELTKLSSYVAQEWLDDVGESSKNTMRGFLSSSDIAEIMDEQYLIHELDRYFNRYKHIEWKLKYKVMKVFEVYHYPYAILRDIQNNLMLSIEILNQPFHKTVMSVKDSIVHEINTGNELIGLNTIERFDHVDNKYYKEMDVVNDYIDNGDIDKSLSGTVTNFNNGITSNIIISEYQKNRIKLINPKLIDALSTLLVNFAGKVRTRESYKNGTCYIYTFTKDMLEDISSESLSVADYFIGGNLTVNTKIDYDECTTLINNLLEDSFVLYSSIK